MNGALVSSWDGVLMTLGGHPPRTVFRVEKGLLPHPLAAGMTQSIGMPEGQQADYRMVLRHGSGLHVKDFGSHYEAHLDEVHPDVNLAEHLRKDAPGVFIASGVALGALVGRSVGTSRDGTVVGAAIGGLLAAMLVSTREG